MYKIILPKAFPKVDKQVVNNRVFEDGACVVSDEDAQLVVPVFKSFYGCTVEKVKDETPAQTDSNDPSLNATQTKK